jgi:hypothetical protein
MTSQLLIKFDYLSIPLLIELDIPRWSCQLILALEVAQLVLFLGCTTHVVQLHLVTLLKNLVISLSSLLFHMPF